MLQPKHILMESQELCDSSAVLRAASHEGSHTLTQQIPHVDEGSGDRMCSGAFVKY